MDREQRMQEIREHIKKYAEAKSKRIYLEHFRKSKLAILMKTCCDQDTAVNFQEREARRHHEYLEVLDGLKEAVEIEEKARWELKLVEMNFEEWRTRHADQRAERQRYNA